MGSFNRACSISSLSIGCGDPVAFFFLRPNTGPRSLFRDDRLNWNLCHRERLHRVGVSSGLIYSNCYFNPLALPIMGEYNDYGGVESIVEDTNTRALEKFFELSIDEIVGVVTCCRDITDTYASSFASCAKDKEAMTGYGDDELPFDGKWLIRMGFTPDTTVLGFRYPKFPDFVVSLFQKERKIHPPNGEEIIRHETWFKILDKDGKEVATGGGGYRVKSELQNEFYKLTGYHLNVAEEYQERFEILNSLSGMFVHREIYDALANSPVEDYWKERLASEGPVTDEMLEKYGFERIPPEAQRTTGLNHPYALWRKGDWDVKQGWRAVDLIHQRHKEYCDLHLSYGCAKTLRGKWQDLTGTDPDETFPEPSDFKDPREDEKDAIRAAFRELTGYNLYVGHHDDTKRCIWNLAKFAAAWKEFTGEELDISEYEGKDRHIERFDKFRQELIEFEEKKKNWKPKITMTAPSVEKQREDWERMKESRFIDGEALVFEPRPEGEEYEIDNWRTLDWDDPFGYMKSREGFLEFYCRSGGGQEWEFFKEIYREAILEGNQDLKEAFSTQLRFSMSMYSCNRFYFPAMNGEQCGNPEETKNLLLASLAVVDKTIMEREDW
jgi:hypothetical protein